ncbi:hypothetical protein Ae168Ps1_3485c [Pseudonocardia sp. Ae168_Ps1]|uniref:hypothetical protein n=1 Tax=unclassified Pseudonocardia TaxID=2619320 RepID=UPI00094B3B16|nr:MULTISPECIES: hypothetical protein [unclassified Pseudonocardia]OLL75084.1 hypothetical protein Ae150APs1_3462c [Pseudonocardia sp. Ae150A_Ps1]OLL81079.1 hypothetical protein Ae168Ps1_3485c [Pseudonocardia sp. Ae168_Ps1]OLL84806.1 hypothetical protein Ae263Ps1_1861 [Pseudonocardia sp. Ae263_Ps1]OLL95177.1 hypothetical protein Ae356Ps1_5074c [Pseudonocardia sp. Ae356_Ps1]
MRQTVRTLTATALAVPMTLGVAGMAVADDSSEQNQTSDATASSGQAAGTDQDNTSLAPVTQANPAVNATDVLGLGAVANEDSDTGTEQSIVQDNGIDSANEQDNAAKTDQAQKTVVEQIAGLAG